MSEERRKVLQMLSSGQVSAEEAEHLLDALERPSAAATATISTPPARPRYLRIEVHQEGDEDGPVMVNVRVPIQLLRAGVKLASVIPPQAQEHVNQALRERGVPFDLSRLRPEDLDELIEQLQDLTIDVDQQGDKEKVKVTVFCE
jgi:SHOCT-like protein